MGPKECKSTNLLSYDVVPVSLLRTIKQSQIDPSRRPRRDQREGGQKGPSRRSPPNTEKIAGHHTENEHWHDQTCLLDCS